MISANNGRHKVAFTVDHIERLYLEMIEAREEWLGDCNGSNAGGLSLNGKAQKGVAKGYHVSLRVDIGFSTSDNMDDCYSGHGIIVSLDEEALVYEQKYKSEVTHENDISKLHITTVPELDKFIVFLDKSLMYAIGRSGVFKHNILLKGKTESWPVEVKVSPDPRGHKPYTYVSGVPKKYQRKPRYRYRGILQDKNRKKDILREKYPKIQEETLWFVAENKEAPQGKINGGHLSILGRYDSQKLRSSVESKLGEVLRCYQQDQKHISRFDVKFVIGSDDKISKFSMAESPLLDNEIISCVTQVFQTMIVSPSRNVVIVRYYFDIY